MASAPVSGAPALINIPSGLTQNYFKFHAYDHSTMMDYSLCNYAFLVDRNNYTFPGPTFS